MCKSSSLQNARRVSTSFRKSFILFKLYSNKNIPCLILSALVWVAITEQVDFFVFSSTAYIIVFLCNCLLLVPKCFYSAHAFIYYFKHFEFSIEPISVKYSNYIIEPLNSIITAGNNLLGPKCLTLMVWNLSWWRFKVVLEKLFLIIQLHHVFRT